MREVLKAEEAKLDGKNPDFDEAKTSDTSEQESELFEG